MCATSVPIVIIEWTQAKYISRKYNKIFKTIGIPVELVKILNTETNVHFKIIYFSRQTRTPSLCIIKYVCLCSLGKGSMFILRMIWKIYRLLKKNLRNLEVYSTQLSKEVPINKCLKTSDYWVWIRVWLLKYG